ncbi:MAG TPA: hypothetical protein VF423_00115 [Actinomycetes bacterium]|jgi:hypothetical protein
MTASIILAVGEEHARDLPAEPWAIGVGAFVLLVVLLAVTMSFGKDR